MQAERRSIPLFVPSYTWHEQAAMEKVMANGQLNEGPYVREAEQIFAQHVGARYCILVPNGALALFLACELKVKPDEIWGVPANYGIFAANALLFSRAQVFLRDVDRKTGVYRQADMASAESWASKLPVHANGRLSSTVEKIQIEDCAQAISHHTKDAISCYSFHSTKMITAGGIGGAVCCDSKEDYEMMYAIKDHGRPERVQGKVVPSVHSGWGTNLKFSDINAAFLIEQMKKLPERIAKFDRDYAQYKDLLSNKNGISWLEGKPSWRVDCLVPDPDAVISKLAMSGISAQRFYVPTYKQPQFKDSETKYPNASYLYSRGLYLPSSYSLTSEDIAYVCEKLEVALQ